MRNIEMFGVRRAIRGVSFALLLLGAVDSTIAQEADLILHGGVVYTVDARNSVAEAVAVRGDRILATGSDEAVLALGGASTRKIDLAGRTVLPGLIDSHGHLGSLARSLQSLDFVGTTRYGQIVDMVAARAGESAQDRWITGRGWDQNDWPEKEFQSHHRLSEAVPNHPVFLTRIDGHAGLANALALEIAGVDKETPDPPGGKILRDPRTGEATGVLIDNAQGLVARHIPSPSRESYKASFEAAFAECVKNGLTTVHEAGVSGRQIEVYKELIDEGKFDLRVYAMISGGDRRALDAYFKSGPLIGYGERRLTVRSIKLMIDGALGSRGAALLEPYADDPGNMGLLTTRPEQLRGITLEALAHGFQVCTHAIGDRGNRMVLDIFAESFAAFPNVKDHRFRIEHAQVVALEDIPRFARLGVIPSMQATHATSDMYWAVDRLGPRRIRGAYAWRRFLDAGSRIANGSDFPVERVNPMHGFYAAVARRDQKGWPEGGWQPGQRMTRTEALRSFTIDAAYAAFEEEIVGSLEKGKLADLIVVEKNVMEVAEEEIFGTRVDATILGGRIVFQR